MRHAVMGFFILIMLIFAGASIYTAETKTMHQNELDSILGAAMEESMEILTVNPTYSIGKEVEPRCWLRSRQTGQTSVHSCAGCSTRK